MKKISFNLAVALFFLGGLLFLILLAWILQIDTNSFNPQMMTSAKAPGWPHVLGTDDMGRDVFWRCIAGAGVSLSVGLISVMIMLSVGTLIGLMSGYLGGWVDEVVMRLVDIFMSIPTIFLILTIQVLLKPSIYNVMIVIGLTSWTSVCRLVRAEVLSVKERAFVTAARARGIGNRRLLFKHILPHTINPIIVAGMLGIGYAILTESVLSFLGLGVQPPQPSWGNMLKNSLGFMTDAPWLAIAPGLFITFTVLAFNFLGDELRAVFQK